MQGGQCILLSYQYIGIKPVVLQSATKAIIHPEAPSEESVVSAAMWHRRMQLHVLPRHDGDQQQTSGTH